MSALDWIVVAGLALIGCALLFVGLCSLVGPLLDAEEETRE